MSIKTLKVSVVILAIFLQETSNSASSLAQNLTNELADEHQKHQGLFAAENSIAPNTHPVHAAN